MKILSSVIAMAAVLFVLALLGTCSITTMKYIPDYAGAYLDRATKTYIPLACVKKWRETPSTVGVEVELATVGEARRLKYRVEEVCAEYTAGQPQSLLRSWLSDRGWLSKPEEWWDRPYKAEDGVVHPKPMKAP